jgi:hypothetical protein
MQRHRLTNFDLIAFSLAKNLPSAMAWQRSTRC